ncbi:Na+-driven multidrug efflux pump [Dokdonia sp. Hel_I_63]|uniref:lipopolysaccharide biosynthesis protein n=1 Tax=unclassified Dokdonia TaxID=2615033 RepID=UPI00020A6DE7|nr:MULTISPECIES: polysaccharide biosynthesis protein [unclassified Dokdonia]AEE20753.1 polysaccharide biosynthesis protein [Dokdonia sp. 4H-3-7-5]TVZ22993.1 Na+-driven multidrug efflux pump [Dokdonia sp. Hel_I_63]
MKNANKVVYNTGILYLRLILGLVIGLITTRFVLEALGETDYGIYMLVAGIVAMLGILNSNMSNTSMRFIAHSLGSNDEKLLIATFNTTLFLHYFVGIVVVILMLFGGYILFENFLNIPLDKVFDAKVIFGCMVLTTLITVISVPYDALINAHENLIVLSLVDIVGDILKLLIAIYLLYSDTELLIQYGVLMLGVQIILRVIKQVYSRVNYKESKVIYAAFDKKLMKSILNFTGWNLFGSLAAVSVIQIRSILLNSFFGVRINAAEGISKSASTALNMVSTSMTMAINPQMVKSEGSGDRERMIYITKVSAKFSIFLFGLFAVPVFIEAPLLLELWLVEIPDFVVIFFQITVLTLLLEKFTFPITDAIRAIGDIRKFQITETFLFLLNIPTAYLLFSFGYSPSSIYIVGLSISGLVFFNRLYFGKKIVGIKPYNYILESIIPVIIPISISLIIALLFYFNMKSGFFRLLVVSFSFGSLLTVMFWKYGINKNEKDKFIQIANTFLARFKNK